MGTICAYCGKEIEEGDLSLGTTSMHFSCSLALQKEMTKYGLIFVHPADETHYDLTKRFGKFLNRTLNHTRLHIVHDETVDEDIVDLQGVMRAILGFVKGKVPDRQIGLFSEIIFNGLMAKKYGIPLPYCKQFSARVQEFSQEVYSFQTTEEESKLFRRIINKETPNNIGNEPKPILGMVPINEDFDLQLEKATLSILEIIDKIAIKVEELGATTQWRNFRKDELLLQTIQGMIKSHLETAPIPQVVIKETEMQIFKKSMDKVFLDILTLSKRISKQCEVPQDVAMARLLNNVLFNVIRAYIEVKKKYYREYSE